MDARSEEVARAVGGQARTVHYRRCGATAVVVPLAGGAMKYEVTSRGPRLEAIGAHSGYRIRMSTVGVPTACAYPVNVWVRGSESEDEVKVPIPKRSYASPTDALDHGYACAVTWIDAMNHRLADPEYLQS
jgi:hypothetical protein